MFGRKRRRQIEDTLRASQEMGESQQRLDAAIESYSESVVRWTEALEARDGMTVGALRAIIAGIPDETRVLGVLGHAGWVFPISEWAHDENGLVLFLDHEKTGWHSPFCSAVGNPCPINCRRSEDD